MHSTLTPPTTAGSPRSPAPFVSVIIAYYKQERFLSETIESVRQQSYQNFEIIVVDDGSPVPAASVIAGWRDARLEIGKRAYCLGRHRTCARAPASDACTSAPKPIRLFF